MLRPHATRTPRHPLSMVVAMLVAMAVLASTAWAHMMPAQQGTLNIVENAVFAALSLPVSALSDVDDNRDARLSTAELAAHTVAIQEEVTKRFRIANGGTPGRIDLVMPMAEPDERDSTSSAGSMHVLVLMKATFDAPPSALQLETDLFGTAANEQQFTFKATRGKDAEVVVLTPRRSTHTFFRTPLAVLRDFVRVGVEHILLGTDHLLFLLTLIVAAAGWRYWLSVLTSFTIAHSITLTASLLGVVRMSPSIVEPMIAASIVLMAVLNLMRPTAPSTVSPIDPHALPSISRVASLDRVGIVFACGLLHGLGFASAMSDMDLKGANRISSLVGFNLGIELGQAIFLFGVLAVGMFARQLLRMPQLRPLGTRLHGSFAPARLVSMLAIAMGSVWLLERVGESVHGLA